MTLLTLVFTPVYPRFLAKPIDHPDHRDYLRGSNVAACPQVVEVISATTDVGSVQHRENSCPAIYICRRKRAMLAVRAGEELEQTLTLGG
jgi:hypothetical protein